eukprot:3212255-Heterocapsa_arctica.AAC.1
MHRTNKDNIIEEDLPGANMGSKELQRLEQRYHNNDMNMEVKRGTHSQAHRLGTQPNSEVGRLQDW